MRRAVVLSLCAAALGGAVLAGCATDNGPPVGFSDQQLEAARFRVAYRGTSGMGQPEVGDRALLHAADLTLAKGFDWFRVVGRAGGLAPATSPAISLGIGGFNFGRSSAVGGDVGTTFGGEPGFIASLEILCGRGPPPQTPDVYDARQVAANLHARFG